MLKTEGANQHCADRPLKSGSSSTATPDDNILPQDVVSEVALNRNQRCFRYLDCFNGGESLVCSLQRIAETWGFPLLSCTVAQRNLSKGRGTATTFKAVYLSSQFDRKTDCYRNGSERCGCDAR